MTFEIRLTGKGGGAWSVQIADGECRVAPGFAPKADVRYTADARTWCGVALGLIDPRKALASGEPLQEGGARPWTTTSIRSPTSRAPPGAEEEDPDDLVRTDR